MRQKLLPRTLAVVLFFGFLLPLWAQTGSRVQKQSVAIFVETGPTVDGVLDDPVWELSAPLSDLQQRDPQEGAPASEYTTIRIVYTKDAIYFGFRCDDSQPAAIIATERRRDQDLTKDDSVAVILDTFHDRRNAFLFRTNSLGTQFDAASAKKPLLIPESKDLCACDPALSSSIHLNQNIPAAIGPDGNGDIGTNVKVLEEPFEVAVKVNKEPIARLEKSFPGDKMVTHRLLFPILILDVFQLGSKGELANQITIGARFHAELKPRLSLVAPGHKSDLRIEVSLDQQVFTSSQKKITIPQNPAEG